MKASEPLLSIPSTTNAVTSGCMRCCRGFVDAGLCISRSCTIFGDNSRSCSSREVAILCSRMWNSRQRSSICRQFTLRSACLEAGMSSSTLGRYLRSTDWLHPRETFRLGFWTPVTPLLCEHRPKVPVSTQTVVPVQPIKAYSVECRARFL